MAKLHEVDTILQETAMRQLRKMPQPSNKVVTGIRRCGKSSLLKLMVQHLLSSEYSTYLSGRCVEIEMFPLSFREFIDFHGFEVKEVKSALGGTRTVVFHESGGEYQLVYQPRLTDAIIIVSGITFL